MQNLYLCLLIAYVGVFIYFFISKIFETRILHRKIIQVTNIIMSVLSAYFCYSDIEDNDVLVCQNYLDVVLRECDLLDEVTNCKIIKKSDKKIQISFGIKCNNIMTNERTIEFQKNNEPDLNLNE